MECACNKKAAVFQAMPQPQQPQPLGMAVTTTPTSLDAGTIIGAAAILLGGAWVLSMVSKKVK